MKPSTRITRALTAVLVGATLMMVTAPIVSADKGKKRHKRERVTERHDKPRYRASKRHDKPRYRARERHDKPRYQHRRQSVRHHSPRRIYQRPVRPWHINTRRIYIDDSPFYFHAGLDIFFNGVGLRINLGNIPPVGYGYYDPYCSLEFETVDFYHRHLSRYRHRGALEVYRILDYWDY